MSSRSSLGLIVSPAKLFSFDGRQLWFRLCLFVGPIVMMCFVEPLPAAERIKCNDAWRFARFGAMPEGGVKDEPDLMEKPGFDDSQWRRLDLPHDWGIEGPFRADLANRTGKLPWAGIGWYRKQLEISPEDKGKRLFLDFDGAMSNTQVWLNGKRVGEWPYGYSSFRLELTDAVDWEGDNVVAVRLDNPPESSRWYPGGGIYRNVWLVKSERLALAHWGVFVSSSEVSKSSAMLDISIEVENRTKVLANPEVSVAFYEIGLSGESIPRKIAYGELDAFKMTRNWSKQVTLSVPVESPQLWSVEEPYLYKAVVTVSQGGEATDTEEVVFGIRNVTFDATNGMLINGEQVKLKGVCLHHDLGPLGAAVNRRAIERQLELLQEMGCNAVRTAHNPPAPELLELCDRMGILVVSEAFDCWAWGKTPNDYGLHFSDWYERDIEAFVKRDRNHPSVILWSSGNEIREQGTASGHEVSMELTRLIKQFDSTRLVTAGCNNPESGMNGFQKTIDVFGYNYKPHLYEKIREINPHVPLYGSETSSTVSSRGEYFFPVKEAGVAGYQNHQVSSYDLYYPRWATTADREFEGQDRNPFVMGEFVWTGFDYLGEPTPYNPDVTNALNFQGSPEATEFMKELQDLGRDAPSRSSYFGIFDLCGFRKDRFYLYQARWRPELAMAHILPHWNWPERIGKVTPVHVYTSGDEAELFLNGESLGRKKVGAYEYRLRWDDVVYQSGELKVVAYKNGEPWAESVMKTSSDAAKLALSVDRSEISADGQDLAFVTVQVSDEKGQIVPRTHNKVKYTIEGPGEIIAVGNGDPTSHESFQATERKVFNGLALVVIRSKVGESGRIRLTADSNGLKSSLITIRTK